jgi:hypothetical protein
MTTPVISETNAMSFVRPAAYTMKEVPEPIDTRIRIQEIPPKGTGGHPVRRKGLGE